MTEQLPLFNLPAPAPADPAPAPPDQTPPEAPPPDVTPNTLLAEAIEAWAAHLQGQRELNTIKSFSSDLRLLARFLGPTRLAHIATRDLNRWLQAEREKRVSPKTYARRVTSIKSFFRWLAQTGVLGSDPAAPVIQQTVISPLPQVLTDAEVQRVLAVAETWQNAAHPDPRARALFWLLLQTGIKKGECLALEPGDVEPNASDGPQLWVRQRQRTGTANAYRERKLRLDPAWVPVFQIYLPYRERYLQDNPTSDGRAASLFPWSARRLEYLLQDLAQAAGLDKPLSFDVCRWTSALRDLRAGLDPDRLRQKMGLSRIQWREVYMKLKQLNQPAV